MFVVKIGKYCFDIGTTNGTVQVGGQLVELDLLAISETSNHIIHQNKSYNVEVVEFDRAEKLAKIKVNGNVYKVQVTTQLDLLLKQLGMDSLIGNKVSQLKAPMPGLVLSVLIAEGDEVKKGDSLIVLEAMKMENIIKSPTDAVVKKIEVVQGDKIEKNTVLIQFA